MPVLPSDKDSSFGLKLQDNDLYGCTYIKEFSDTKNLSSVKVLGDVKQSYNNLSGAFITHIDGVLMFSTTQVMEHLTLLYDQWEKAKEQEVEQDFSFDIAFAREAQLKGKKLKTSNY